MRSYPRFSVMNKPREVLVFLTTNEEGVGQNSLVLPIKRENSVIITHNLGRPVGRNCELNLLLLKK
jgi:hypothetical protein